MPVSQEYFFNLSQELIEIAHILDIRTIEELRKIAHRLVEDPELDFENRINEFVNSETDKFVSNADKWILATLPFAYMKGIQIEDRELSRMLTSPKMEGNAIPPPRFTRHTIIIGEASDAARQAIPSNHLSGYARYEATFRHVVRQSKMPYMQSALQHYREIAGAAIQPAFMQGDTATRRTLAQQILNEFSDRGIKTAVFPSGHRMSIDAFAEREARAYTQHVALQGQMNRAVERGYDLVQINQYAGPSPMCEPYQGKVFSLTGDSDQYPPLDDAIFAGSWDHGGGIYHDYSYFKDMEAYTKKGWKFIKDLNKSDQILSLNPETHEPEWTNIVRLHSYRHTGEMVHLYSNSFDLCVTPDHDLYIGYRGRQGKKRITKYKFCKAEEAIERAWFSQLRCVDWIGEKQPVPINGVTHKQFAKLLAWYISDGYCEKPNGKWTKVCIRKIKKKHVSVMSDVLLEIGFKYSNGRFWQYNHEWAEYFSKFGKSHEKFLPEWILNERQEIIKTFLDAYVYGDGSKRDSGFKGYESKAVTYYTSSKRLAEQLGECIIKSGKYPSFTEVESKGVPVKHHNGTYEGNHDIWHVRQNNIKESYYCNSPSTKGNGLKSELIDHDDFVYCVTLEKNHILWVRRNGKTTWSGNCGHFQSTYIPGVSEGATHLTDSPEEQAILNSMGEARGNRHIFEQRQVQRKNEYQIRQYKKRMAASLDPRDRERNKKLVRTWQARQREHLKENPFLRRNYTREQV